MTIRKLTAIGIAFGLGVSGASADEVCGIGRVAVDLEGTVQITPEIGRCTLLEKTLVVSRYFPTSQFLVNLGFPGTCFVGEIQGNVTIAGKAIPVEGTSYSAQYAGEAFKAFETDPDGVRIVSDYTTAPSLNQQPWVIGEANTYVELTRVGQTVPFLSVGFDDTFFYKPDGSADSEKFTAVSPGVTGALVAEGPIFWPGAPLKGRLCMATTLLR